VGIRLKVFGKQVHIAGLRSPSPEPYGRFRNQPVQDPVSTPAALLGNPAKLVVSGHLLGVTLGSINATVHPPIM